MADTGREVTKEDIEAIAAKLGPAVDSLTEGEREVFASILERAGAAGDEVSGFAFAPIKMGGSLKAGGSMAVGWESPLSGQLATAAGMAAPPGKDGIAKWS